ncbi:DUF3592 domain-containing protein [Duganella sp. Root1480D1]|uniref:DUF3592 domain-containing protein n=1 Tax=Duganella sp. Root1480D1 TaxID=1736471 RepID=UPI000AAD0C8A|nr:DUF3592 domain-containing protein [Duganella sp. Root1480D1]
MKASDFGARLVVLLFALAFALVFTWGGVWACLRPLYMQLHDSWTANSYVPVPARVESIVLDEWSSKKTGTAYRARGEFSYEFQGSTYHGNRLNFSLTADNKGGYQHALYAKLNKARTFGRPVNLWVDPNNPEFSVYDRSIRWDDSILELVFGLLFTAGGLYAWRIVYRIFRV